MTAVDYPSMNENGIEQAPVVNLRILLGNRYDNPSRNVLVLRTDQTTFNIIKEAITSYGQP